MTTLINLSATDLRKAADLKEQIEALQAQLEKCLGGGVGNGSIQVRRQPGQVRTSKTKVGKTVVDSILEVLTGGQIMSIRDIKSAASKIRGKPISPGLMSVTLAYLKRTKRIGNPDRGQYRRL